MGRSSRHRHAELPQGPDGPEDSVDSSSPAVAGGRRGLPPRKDRASASPSHRPRATNLRGDGYGGGGHPFRSGRYEDHPEANGGSAYGGDDLFGGDSSGDSSSGGLRRRRVHNDHDLPGPLRRSHRKRSVA